jgi:hypothetical protein
MPAHIHSVTNSIPTAPPASAEKPKAENPKPTERAAGSPAPAQDSVKISDAGKAASQSPAPQKSTTDVDHDADSK